MILSVEGLSTKNKRLSNISFQIKKGEIVGIYGLRDQGQTLLLETIFGAYKRTTGEIKLEGKKVKIKSPVDALRQGIVYVPNRGIKTVFPFKSVVENLILQFSNFKESGIFIRERTEKLFVEEIVRKFTVRGYLSIDEKLSSLSGGNMQKVLIARAMILRPKLLMLIEPTEGIDIGAKQEVKELILQAAKEGTAVIIVTSEIDDIIELCNRVIVIRDGKIRNIMEANEENRRAIIEESIA